MVGNGEAKESSGRFTRPQRRQGPPENDDAERANGSCEEGGTRPVAKEGRVMKGTKWNIWM
jgi:hypothetical protein